MGDGGVVACAPSRSLIAALASKPFKMRRAEDDGKDSPIGDDRRVEIEDGELVPDRSPQRGDPAPGKRRKGADSDRYDVPRDAPMERRRKGSRERDDIYRRRDRDRDDRDRGWRERTPEDSHRRGWGWQKDGSPGLDLNRTPEDTHQRKEWGWRKDDDRRRDGDWQRDRTPDDRWRKDGLERDRTPDDRRRDGDWRKDGLERDRTPDNSQRRRDCDESGSEYRKRLPSKMDRFEAGAYEQKYPEELRQKKYELSNGKGREKGYDADNRQKRHCPEFDSSSRKYNAEHADRPGSRSWKDGEDWKPQANRDRSYQDASSISSRGSSVGRYSTSRRHIESSLPSRGGHDRHNESSLPSRGGHDRHGRSPERARHHDTQDRSPSYLERPQRDSARQYDHRNHTPGSSDRSQHERSRHQDYRDISPSRSNRSPRERGRYLDYRDRTPSHYDRSPYERVRSRDHRDHTPNNSDRSSQERVRYHDQQAQSPSHSNRSPVVYRERDRSPGRSENSSHDRGRNSDSCDQYKNVGSSERQQSSRLEERPARECTGKDAPKNSSSWQSNSSSSNGHDIDVGDDSKKKNGSESSNKEPIEPSLPAPAPPPPPFLPPSPLPPHPEANGILEELPSMEEDMDICDTPPHDTITTDMGKWSYIDQLGIQRGPSKLADLQRLVEEGFLQSDHLVTHSDTNRWVTVENAASPMLPMDLPSTVSDVVTQMVISRESPGNVLDDSGHHIPEMFDSKLLQESQLDDGRIASESVEDLCIDERVEALLNGQMIMDGNERQNLGEALGVNFEHVEWEKWGQSEGFTGFHVRNDASFECPIVEGAGRTIDDLAGEATEIRPSAPYETECAIGNHIFSDCFAGRWSCKGGDWKRNDENYKRKNVLNGGYPLCQMEKFRLEDPRLYRKDDLYYPSRLRKHELVPWSFSSSEDMYENDVNKNMSAVRTGQIKLPVTRGVKGTMLPVVRINACVVKEHVSNEPRMKVKGKERHTPRSSRAHSSLNDINSISEGSYHSKKLHKRDLQSLHECRTALNIPKDHVCTVDELSLHLGGWYYLDGAGHEHGPSSYSELQELVTKGTIPEYSSVFRKIDNTWLPIATSAVASKAVHTQDVVPAANISTASLATQSVINHAGANNVSGSFHSVYPQFVGYMRGKLHELVMKSYKNREFAAAINEVLDPWLSSSQPKKDVDKHFAFNSSFTKSSATLAHVSSGDKFWKSDASMLGIYEDSSVKRVRLLVDGSGESEAEERLLAGLKNDRSFEELRGEASFVEDDGTSAQAETECWGSLDGHILARIFHFLRTDLKSLCSSANTCKRWNMAVKFYNSLCKHVEFSAAGLNCTDSVFQNIMHTYEKKNITSIGLAGCFNVSARMLEEVLPLLPCLSIIDIRGCSQFKDLEYKYQDIIWIKTSPGTRIPEETNTNIRSLKQITEESFSGLDSYLNDVGEAGYAGSREVNMVDRKDPSHTSRQGFYKRRKLLDSKKSSTIPSRDAQMRHWLYRKSKNGYRKMEEFIALSLKDIMKGNRFEFFIPKVAKIEGKMKSGYYIRNGLGSVKDDISRMCRDALKAKTRDNAGDLQQVILSFIQLAQSLKENPKLSREREEMLKKLKDGSDTGFFSLTTKYSKKQNKVTSEKKGINRSQNTSYANGGTDHETYVFDREIKRSLFKLKKIRGSESEPSDDNDDDLFDDVRGGTESTDSDTESDLDLHLGGGRVDRKYKKYSMPDDVVDLMEDDREWGARMTKASLVPPVTRTYELINEYLIIADEEEVRRKMSVSLPDDFAEKLHAQDTGMEETDMELPKVKEYKPRKIVGVEVLEQEVYGIDPYTHNLLLDSMPDEPDWPLAEKHKFVEEVLPCILNKQVRHFTGVGNTPMVYPLRLVIEEIQKKAEKDGDGHIIRMCQTILKAMQARPDDNYVAYRKGLGVVCNKEEGFDEDDFVVEFLGEVYPIWKWFEKQDGIKSLQKNSEEQVPEFYNIYLERPKGDRDGYDLVIVDAMHKANFASRICHSCKPNCEAKVIAVNGQYQIGIYTVRPISYGEEITFDYNCVTDSMKEYEDSVCLCGSQVCRGSYLNLTGEDAFQKVLDDCHGILDRHKLMLEACESNDVSQEDYIDLERAGLGACLLAGLPDWLVAYSAHLVRFINFERTRLPDEILKHNLEEKRKIFSDISLEVEKNEAEVQAEGVYNSRLQSMAITLDKVRYVMRCVFGDAKASPPPLQKLSSEALVSVIWEGEGSLVEELLQSMAPHVEEDILDSLKSNIDAHNPSHYGDLRRELRKSLLWLRDELRNLPCSSKCRNDAAADLIHMYAYTKCFFKVREYKTIKSPPVYISPLDLGPKYADKMGSGLQEYRKTYDENYCLSQLIYWHSTQPKIDPVCSLAEARKGCLSLPDVSSFYAKSNKPSGQHIYGSRTLRFMMSRMERQPQTPWPEDRIWSFKSRPRFFGSPMLDAVLNSGPLDKEMMHWLKTRPVVFHGAWDG